MSYKVLKIEEDVDFGCEERSSEVMVMVTLQDEAGQRLRLRQPDQLLYDRDINEGDCAVIGTDGQLIKQ